MSSEKFKNVSPIAFPAMTAELEDIVQGFKARNRPAGIAMAKLILREARNEGQISVDDWARIFRDNFGFRDELWSAP
jgi:hypothetical protein